MTFDIDAERHRARVAPRISAPARNKSVQRGGLERPDRRTRSTSSSSEAEKFKQSDEQAQASWPSCKNNAEALLYTSERAVDECAELVDAAIIDAGRAATSRTCASLIGGSRRRRSRSATRSQQLEPSAYKIAESMYGDASAAQAEEQKG